MQHFWSLKFKICFSSVTKLLGNVWELRNNSQMVAIFKILTLIDLFFADEKTTRHFSDFFSSSIKVRLDFFSFYFCKRQISTAEGDNRGFYFAPPKRRKMLLSRQNVFPKNKSQLIPKRDQTIALLFLVQFRNS